VRSYSRLVIFFHFQKYRPDAAAGKVAEMRQQEFAGKAAAAMTWGDRNRKDLGFIRRLA
jgi:hypothetical protein